MTIEHTCSFQKFLPLVIFRIIIGIMAPLFPRMSGLIYRRIARPICFLFDSEPIHDFMVSAGYIIGKIPGIPKLFARMFFVTAPELATDVGELHLENPVGLSAGFDHEAKLPTLFPGLGFGFGSVGTVTNRPYGGNAYPRIKRLPKSRSLLVYKGFKSTGMDAVLRRLSGAHFPQPVGISIGRTNADDITTHDSAIADIVSAFQKVLASDVAFSYLELNISCPNLKTKVEFYTPDPLRKLLSAVCALSLPRPLLIKMPISLSNEDTLALLDVIGEFPVAGIIIGNLQKDRDHPAFDKAEMEEFRKYPGNWSGMPCKDRSDELIALVYRHTKGRLPIVGCGGVFSGEDAFRKITLGASAIQLATALVFMGPHIPAEINLDLFAILKKKNITRLSDVVGSALTANENTSRLV